MEKKMSVIYFEVISIWFKVALEKLAWPALQLHLLGLCLKTTTGNSRVKNLYMGICIGNSDDSF